ncbi:MAG: hypothetical protein AB7F96_18870 [Beijerinckiaceae bacterium]
MPLSDGFRGILIFHVAGALIIAMLIALPAIVTWLPEAPGNFRIAIRRVRLPPVYPVGTDAKASTCIPCLVGIYLTELRKDRSS